MIDIGPYQLRNNLFLAPMVGVSDTPFREICSQQGAALTIGEMLTSNTDLWTNERNRLKQVRPRINSPQVVQIAGSEPAQMAHAAAMNVALGADAIDINMGCPAKKVLKKAAGSALLKDTRLVRDIVSAVVKAVSVPVTLKIRTGWCPESRNGVEVAKIAEQHGIQLLTVHGRTRACRFKGNAEYDTIAAIKAAVSIPVIANGDIDSPLKAAAVLHHTNADGVMIGRAAQGRPWLFQEIEFYLKSGTLRSDIPLAQRQQIICDHVSRLHQFYGDVKGVWYARKHVIAYVNGLPQHEQFLRQFNLCDSATGQLEQINHYCTTLLDHDESCNGFTTVKGAIAA